RRLRASAESATAAAWVADLPGDPGCARQPRLGVIEASGASPDREQGDLPRAAHQASLCAVRFARISVNRRLRNCLPTAVALVVNRRRIEVAVSAREDDRAR